jgi:hypothetical protein|mmetsp:Transcript_66448/g.198473  ORF Transcript_66448/g.198473 Transcript_66448/m.198473 type:complete len:251 (-) Transcript_66448:110-862(-)|eukprot:457155-Prymnesium_polylepis.1
MAQGVWRPKTNKILVAAARRALAACADLGQTIQWQHMKTHSGDTWKDRADELAKMGAALAEPTAAPPERRNTSSDPPLQPTRLADVSVRWVTWQLTEARRVLRARTAHGTLNAISGSLDAGGVAAAGAARLALLEAEASHPGGAAHAREAKAAVQQAMRALADPSVRRRETRERKQGWLSSVLRCPINVGALKRLSEERGTESIGMGIGPNARSVYRTQAWCSKSSTRCRPRPQASTAWKYSTTALRTRQ